MSRRRSRARRLEFLRSLSFFAGWHDRELSRLAGLADEVEVPTGTVLVREGQNGTAFYVVVDGTATAARRGRALGSLGPGSFFGEMALLDRRPRSATVTADTPMRLLVVDSRSFAALLRDAPSFSREILEGLTARLREIEEALA